LSGAWTRPMRRPTRPPPAAEARVGGGLSLSI